VVARTGPVGVNGTEEQARAEKEALAVFLREQMKLTLAPEKTHVTALKRCPPFLSFAQFEREVVPGFCRSP
jgi:hypothetical protein